MKYLLILLIFFISITCVCAGDAGDIDEFQQHLDTANETVDLEKDYNIYNNEGKNVEIENRTINGHGHQIYTGSSYNNTIYVKGDVVFNNTKIIGQYGLTGDCNSLEAYNCTFDGSFKTAYTMKVNANRIVLKNCTFLSLYSNDNYICQLSGGNISIIDSIFKRDMDWPVSYAKIDSANFEIINSTFNNASSTAAGSALYLKNSEGLIYASTFTNNQARNGAAVYSDGTKVKISKSIFKNNFAEESAGAIFLNCDNSVIDDAVFENNTCGFMENDFAKDANSIHIKGKFNTITNIALNNQENAIVWNGDGGKIVNSNFTGCKNPVYWTGSSGMIKGCSFKKSSHIEWRGSGGLVEECKFSDNEKCIIWYGSSGKINKCEFTQSSIAIVMWGANGKITNSLFTKLTEGISLDGKNAVMDNNVFKNNDLNSELIHVSSANAVIKNSKFQNNKAFRSIMSVEAKKVTVDNCEFTSNTCKKDAVVEWSAKNGVIKNSVFKNNKGNKKSDGAISQSYGVALKVTKCVFKNNTPEELVFKKYNYKGKVQYGSGHKVTIKVYKRYSNKPLKGVKFDLYYIVNPGNWEIKTTNAKGIIKTKDLSRFKELGSIGCECRIKLPKGNFVYGSVDLDDYPMSYNLIKGKGDVKAPKVVAKRGQSKFLKISVKHKVSKKPLKNIKIKLKVYTGKKYQKYTIKTNKKGAAKFNVKNLSKGKHKVVITSGEYWYSFKKTSSIKIK